MTDSVAPPRRIRVRWSFASAMALGAITGAIVGWVVTVTRTGNEQLLVPYLTYAIAGGAIIGTVVGVVSVSLGLLVRMTIRKALPLAAIVGALTSSLAVLASALLLIFPLAEVADLRGLIWIPIASAFVGTILFGGFSMRIRP